MLEVNGMKLRRIREEHALSMRDLEARSGVARNTIQRIETGKSGAWPRTVRRLAEALEVEPRELLKSAGEE